MTTVGINEQGPKFTEDYTREDNAWTRGILEELGIKLVYKFFADPLEYDTKINLMISFTLADYFLVKNYSQFTDLKESNLLEDMEETFNQYASAKVKEIIAESGIDPFVYVKDNNKILGIPWLGFPCESSNMVWMREDWRVKLGLPEPKSMDDVIKIVTAFAKQDPDGNGTEDTVGMLMSSLNDANLMSRFFVGFANGYGAYPDIWIDDGNGSLVYGSIQPEIKTVLSELRKLYAEGIIGKDALSTERGKMLEQVAAGKAGFFYGAFSDRMQAQDSVKNFNAKWKTYPTPGADGKPAINQGDNAVYGIYVLKKGYKYPEVVTKLLNFWINKFYYPESDQVYETYSNNPKYGAVWVLTPIKFYRTYKNADLGLAVTGVLKGTKKLEDLNPEQKARYNMVKDYLDNNNLDNWGNNMMFGIDGSMSVINYYRENNLFLVNKFMSGNTKTMQEKGSILKDKQFEVFTKIIAGQADISEFDKFVNEWKSLGGDQITKEVNDWYKNSK